MLMNIWSLAVNNAAVSESTFFYCNILTNFKAMFQTTENLHGMCKQLLRIGCIFRTISSIYDGALFAKKIKG